MFGRLAPLRAGLRLWAERHRLRIGVIVGLGSLVAVVFIAAVDFVREARRQEEQVQAAVLRTELAQFLLGLREEDGFPLLENARTASREIRKLSPLKWSKPQFSYFLQRDNSRTFNAQKIRWEIPRSCALEFSIPNTSNEGKQDGANAFKLTACITVVPNDPLGRYIYFSIVYPDEHVVELAPGGNLSNVDRVTLNLVGERQVGLDLVLQRPAAIAQDKRIPDRFRGFHDVTAFQSGSSR